MDWKRRQARSGRQFCLVLLVLGLIALIGLLARYGQTGRKIDERLARRELSSSDEPKKECRKVHHAVDQCAFIKANCPDEEAGLFSYLTLYYCRLGHAKPVAFLIIILWAATLFTTIGVAASEFFCINLSTISGILGLSESMAGVTFLAFGNGSPDVFSTFAAIKSNSGSLAIGELIGAAGFITAVVAGSMALIQDFAVPKKSFIRDVGFFIVAIAFSMSFLANGKLDIWECIIMVGFYGFYVLLVIVWHWRLGRRRRKREQQALARGNYVDAGGEGELDFEGEYRDDEDNTTQARPHYSRHISSADFNALERADQRGSFFPDVDDDVERDRWMGELSSNMRIRKPNPGERQSVYTPIRPSLAGALEFQAAISSIKKSQQELSAPIHLRRYSDDPSYTIGDQQKDLSTSSDPKPGLRNIDGMNHSTSNADSKLASNQISRGRAVSANAADILALSSYGKPPRRYMKRNLGRNHLESHTLQEAPDESLEEQSEPLPLLSVSPPPSQQDSREPPPLRRRSRGSSQSHLFPPADDRHSLESSIETAGNEAKAINGSRTSPRPSLNITPPGEQNPPPLFSSPSEISVALQNSRSSSPRPPSIRLPPSSISDHSEFANHLEGQSDRRSKNWRFLSSPTLGVVFRTLFPSLCGWPQKEYWEKILSVLLVPSLFLLTITLPVVEPEKSNVGERQNSIHNSLPRPQSTNNRAPAPVVNEQVSPSFTGYRDSTAGIAVDTEQRHRHSSIPHSSLPDPTPHVAESASREWNRWLVLIQSFTAPYTIALAAWASLTTPPLSPRTLLRPTLLTLALSLPLLTLLLLTTTPSHPPRHHYLISLLGFAVSVAWISSVATEVVALLKAIGAICNISDAILGLTVFAVGNSLGDLVADVQVARLGYPYMAFSACFGGPMLNILLGIGLSGIYIVLRRADERHSRHPEKGYGWRPYHVDVNVTLVVSAAALLATLVGLLVAVPANGWRMDRRIGWGLIALWCVATAANVAVEVAGWGGGDVA